MVVKSNQAGFASLYLLAFKQWMSTNFNNEKIPYPISMNKLFLINTAVQVYYSDKCMYASTVTYESNNKYFGVVGLRSLPDVFRVNYDGITGYAIIVGC